MNMAYGCQIPVDNPTFLADLIFGFLCAVRLTEEQTGGREHLLGCGSS